MDVNIGGLEENSRNIDEEIIGLNDFQSIAHDALHENFLILYFHNSVFSFFLNDRPMCSLEKKHLKITIIIIINMGKYN